MLSCYSCGLRYPVSEGVPSLMLDSRDLPAQRAPGIVGGLLTSLVRSPVVYDMVQKLAGSQRILERVGPVLAPAAGMLVVDAGAGTGSLAGHLPPSATYVWVDADPEKLHGYRVRSAGPAVLADARRLPFRDRSVDWTVSVGVAHHLDDSGLDEMLAEIRRITKERFVFLDAVAARSITGRLLWRFDRGRHVRTAAALRRHLAAQFTTVHEEEFSALHDYLLLVAQ